MDLEIINKLYLELSQVATAETQRELLLKDALRRILGFPVHSEPMGGCVAMKEIAYEALLKAKCP